MWVVMVLPSLVRETLPGKCGSMLMADTYYLCLHNLLDVDIVSEPVFNHAKSKLPIAS